MNDKVFLIDIEIDIANCRHLDSGFGGEKIRNQVLVNSATLGPRGWIGFWIGLDEAAVPEPEVELTMNSLRIECGQEVIVIDPLSEDR